MVLLWQLIFAKKELKATEIERQTYAWLMQRADIFVQLYKSKHCTEKTLLEVVGAAFMYIPMEDDSRRRKIVTVK